MVNGVRYNPDGSIFQCVFCDIVQGRDATRQCVYRDDRVAAFVPRTSGAAAHYLSVPIAHIKSVKTLDTGGEDALDLLARLDVRDKLFTPEQMPRTMAVFHYPPFTSIDHVHLHLLLTPYANFYQRIKNEPSRWKAWNISLAASKKKYARQSRL